MAGLQQHVLRIPNTWDAAWFRTFVAEVLAKADIRNAKGEGVLITSNGNSVATISTDPAAAGSVANHNLDPYAHEQMMALHKSDADPHPQYLTADEVRAEIASAIASYLVGQ